MDWRFHTGFYKRSTFSHSPQDRKEEIDILTKAIENQRRHHGKLTFQTLPRHQRRRAMSWNIHLLPKYLRKAAQNEAEVRLQ